MCDFNMVNVQAQSQVGKSVDMTKLRMLTMDMKDFTEFLPVLKELQNTSSKILKDLNALMTKREKKTTSLPYNFLKKFETLKGNLVESQKLLEFQGRVYGCNVANRDFEKMHDQQFYRKTLKSYDEKRLWMKQYIHNNEATVQRIEEEVKKNMDYEVHQFTEFRKQLNIQRLEHNYEGKIELIDSNKDLLKTNNKLREKIKSKLAAVIEKRKKKQNQNLFKTHEQSNKSQIATQNNMASNSKLIRVPSFTPLLFFCFTKQMLYSEFLIHQQIAMKRRDQSIIYDNQQLKLAIDKIQQRIEFDNSQTIIAIHQVGQGNEDKECINLLKLHKVTKTDYLIYLKEMQRHCHQILNIFGNYFQYALQNISFPNHTKSKSASKHHHIKPISQQVKSYCHINLMKDFQQYRQKHKVSILKDKKEREELRRVLSEKNKLILKELSKSSSKESGESAKENYTLRIDKILQNESCLQNKHSVNKQQICKLQGQNQNQMESDKQNFISGQGNNIAIELQQQDFGQI